jgi:D-proline reductase (dithiol) PrdB
MVAQLASPALGEPAFVVPPPLRGATVAVVTTAGLSHRGAPWRAGDSSFRAFARGERDLVVSHVSTNFDRVGISADLNVAYPVDRLEELVSEGRIGALGPRNFSFMGALGDLSTVIVDTGPAVAKQLRDDGVEVVLLTPV